MANFTKALSASSVAASGYAVNSEGTEIYRGIDRTIHPEWDGWPIIDALKFAASDKHELQITLAQNKKLGEKVWVWFKKKHWDKFSGDRISDQDIGAELFEASLELGVERTVNCLQKSLNLLNAGRTKEPSIVENGRLGEETLDALETCIRIDGPAYVLNVIRLVQGLHYISKLKKNLGQDPVARERLGNLEVTRRNKPLKPAPPTNLRLED